MPAEAKATQVDAGDLRAQRSERRFSQPIECGHVSSAIARDYAERKLATLELDHGTKLARYHEPATVRGSAGRSVAVKSGCDLGPNQSNPGEARGEDSI